MIKFGDNAACLNYACYYTYIFLLTFSPSVLNESGLDVSVWYLQFLDILSDDGSGEYREVGEGEWRLGAGGRSGRQGESGGKRMRPQRIRMSYRVEGESSFYWPRMRLRVMLYKY